MDANNSKCEAPLNLSMETKLEIINQQEENWKRREALARRPSYRKILNDISAASEEFINTSSSSLNNRRANPDSGPDGSTDQTSQCLSRSSSAYHINTATKTPEVLSADLTGELSLRDSNNLITNNQTNNPVPSQLKFQSYNYNNQNESYAVPPFNNRFRNDLLDHNILAAGQSFLAPIPTSLKSERRWLSTPSILLQQSNAGNGIGSFEDGLRHLEHYSPSLSPGGHLMPPTTTSRLNGTHSRLASANNYNYPQSQLAGQLSRSPSSSNLSIEYKSAFHLRTNVLASKQYDFHSPNSATSTSPYRQSPNCNPLVMPPFKPEWRPEKYLYDEHMGVSRYDPQTYDYRSEKPSPGMIPYATNIEGMSVPYPHTAAAAAAVAAAAGGLMTNPFMIPPSPPAAAAAAAYQHILQQQLIYHQLAAAASLYNGSGGGNKSSSGIIHPPQTSNECLEMQNSNFNSTSCRRLVVGNSYVNTDTTLKNVSSTSFSSQQYSCDNLTYQNNNYDNAVGGHESKISSTNTYITFASAQGNDVNPTDSLISEYQQSDSPYKQKTTSTQPYTPNRKRSSTDHHLVVSQQRNSGSSGLTFSSFTTNSTPTPPMKRSASSRLSTHTTTDRSPKSPTLNSNSFKIMKTHRPDYQSGGGNFNDKDSSKNSIKPGNLQSFIDTYDIHQTTPIKTELTPGYGGNGRFDGSYNLSHINSPPNHHHHQLQQQHQYINTPQPLLMPLSHSIGGGSGPVRYNNYNTGSQSSSLTNASSSLPNNNFGSTGLGGHPIVEEAVRKREVRLLKNREAAKECRRKKKEYVKCLENRVTVLENQNKALIEELKALKELYCQK